MFKSMPTTNHDCRPSPDLAEVVRILAELQRDVAEVRTLLTDRRKPYLTVEELAQLVGRAPYTIRSWIKTKRIHAERVSGTGPRGRLLIPRAELDRLLAEGKGAAVPATALD